MAESKIWFFDEDFKRAFMTPKAFEESVFTLNDLSEEDADKLFQGFYDAYMKSVGASWDRNTFEWKASNWTFFGSVDGGVALRHQRSGLWKLNASYGVPGQVFRGLKEMTAKIGNEPIWGAMTEDIADMLERATKKEFVRPPKLFLKLIFPYMKSALGANGANVTSRGSVMMDTPAGKMEKFFIANKAYYQELLNNADKYLAGHNVPGPIKAALIGILSKMI